MSIISKNISGVCLLLAGIVNVAYAQAPAATGQTAGATRPIEAITVIGRPPEAYRAHVKRLERELVEIFNDSNESQSMDIVCRRISQVHTLISRRVCAPRSAFSNGTLEMRYPRHAINYLITALDRYQETGGDSDQFSAKVASLITGHDAFYAKAVEYADLAWGNDFPRFVAKSDS